MQHFHLDKVTYRILKKERTNIDRAMLAVGIAGPIATIPQLLTIYVGQEVAGVSVVSWAFYAVSSLLTLSYSIVHRLRPMIISSLLWLITNSLVVAGCLIYG
jgi:uncharacterized protein with PQ loop repeat